MSREKLTVGLIQMSMGGDADGNLRHAIRLTEEAADRGAQVVCLPELFTTPYFAQYESLGEASDELAQEIPGEVTTALSETARRKRIVLVGGSLYERSKGRLFNTSPVFDQMGTMLGRYRKMHVPRDEHYFEQDYFEKGNTGFQVFPTDFGKIGVLICYDQWFPEAARAETLMGAEIIFYPTAIGRVEGIEQAEGDWLEAWITVMRGHAIANGTIVAAVNRVGVEDKMTFWGHSFVCDAFGKVLAMGGEVEDIVLAEIDLSHGREVQEGWGFLRNRRPESYFTLTNDEEEKGR